MIILVTASEEHDRAFRQMAGGIMQSVISVREVGSAGMAINEHCPQVVVCDTETKSAGSWHDLLHVDGRRAGFALIVVSRLADDALWAEVLNRGGFDVLSIPFRREEVERVIASALRHACSA